MKKMRISNAVARLAIAALFLLALPQAARAHGELLIRIAALTRQIEAATNNPAPLYLQRGELHREHKDWKVAASDYDRAAQLDPNLVAVDFCRATMLADSGELDAGRAMFDKVIARCSTDGQAFIGRARVLATLGQLKAAVADFQNGISLLREPNPNFFLELAHVQVADGQTNQALGSLDQGLIKLGPVLPLQVYALELDLQLKNHESALARLDAMIERAPRKENWLARRGDILLAAGRKTEALKFYEPAVAAADTLHLRLQQAPHLVKLRSRVNADLAAITSAPPIAKTDEKFSK